jgi:hypothetical protein
MFLDRPNMELKACARRVSSAILWILVSILLAGASPKADFSTPEKTIESYYLGYKLSDRILISRAFLNTKAQEVENVGLGVDQVYTIEKKLLVLYSRLFGREGDIEIEVRAVWRWPQGSEEMKTQFLLRQIGDEWKIVEYHSMTPTGCAIE